MSEKLHTCTWEVKGGGREGGGREGNRREGGGRELREKRIYDTIRKEGYYDDVKLKNNIIKQ